jgi:hypothetical protein
MKSLILLVYITLTSYVFDIESGIRVITKLPNSEQSYVFDIESGISNQLRIRH